MTEKKHSYSKINSSCLQEETTSDYSVCNENRFEDGEMRLAFFSEGKIFIEHSRLKFIIKQEEESNFEGIDCFAQLISDDFCKLFKEGIYFRCDSSPVRFTINFYTIQNQLVGQLISDAIFKNIGYSKGSGKWVSCAMNN